LNQFVPKKVFLTKGVGKSREKLQSFEMALRDAGIAPFNLVRVSSIFPPECKIITKREGLKLISPGQILFVVLSDISVNEPNRLIASSVGLAIPEDSSVHGYLSEHHSFGQNDDIAGDYAEELAASMLASTNGFDMDEDLRYDEKKALWKMKGLNFKTRNITQTALGDKNGLWTTVLAAAVLIMEPLK